MRLEFRPVVLRLIVAQMALHATMSGVRMAAPLLALKLGYSAMSVGVLLALFALAQVFLALPVGRFTDRHGIRLPIYTGLALSSLSVLAVSIWPVFEVLCVTAVLTGSASGTAMISVQRHAGRLSHDPGDIREIFSWMAVAPTLANFAGPFLTGLLIDAVDYRWAFAVLCLVSPVAGLAVRRLQDQAVSPGEAEERRKGSSFDLLRNEPLRKLLLVNWMLSSCWDVHAFMVPLLGHELGLSASAIGTILGAFALAATAIRLTMPWVARHVQEMKAVAVAMMLTGVFFVMYPFSTGAWMMGILSVLLGMSLGSVQPMVMSTLHHVTPRERQGEALGLRIMTIYASSVIMPLLFGSLGALVGATAVFWSIGAVVGLGSRMALRLHRD
jgi:MFS family permease